MNVLSAPHLDRKKQECRNVCTFIKKEKLKYHMVIRIQTLKLKMFKLKCKRKTEISHVHKYSDP